MEKVTVSLEEVRASQLPPIQLVNPTLKIRVPQSTRPRIKIDLQSYRPLSTITSSKRGRILIDKEEFQKSTQRIIPDTFKEIHIMSINQREFLKITLDAVGLLASSVLLTSSALANDLKIVEPETKSVPLYGKFETRIETDVQYTNPFDPREVNLQVHFLTPTGATHTMPTFYDEEDGQPVWKVRYSPISVGTHRYYATQFGGTSSTTPPGDRRSEEHTFECVPSDRDGFIRLSPYDYRYFQFDSGKPYFAVGHNVCWTHDYEHYFKKMAEHGENYTRIWMIHWNVALEWSGGDYPGLGRYHLGKANRIDQILELAEQYGIYIMLCLESFNNLRIRKPYPAYEGNPYAQENGGMLEKPEQFFTDPEARRLFKQRLRYLVARYTYSPNIFCWEFWNEVDIIERYVREEAVPWHQEMARYLRRIDPMEHLISTSFASTAGDDAMWQLPEIEITQNHQYGSRDIAKSVRQWTQRHISEFRKPHIFGEFGTDAGGPRKDKDPNGISLHNGIWAATLSGSAGTAMLWWWDNYIDPNDLYYHFQPLSQFVEDVDWIHANFRDAEIGTIDYITPPDCGIKEKPALRVFGLQNDTEALLWLQNTQHTWYRSFQGITLRSVLPTYVEVNGLQDGEYKIEWWDTYQSNKFVPVAKHTLNEAEGEELRRKPCPFGRLRAGPRSRRDGVKYANAVCTDGVLQLEAPEIDRDIACKIRLQKLSEGREFLE